jgi:3-deoxy-alpha-D-manno-octulosonate 8-oxidase
MRISKTVGQYYFDCGSIDPLRHIVAERQAVEPGPAVYLIDGFFAGSDYAARLPLNDGDAMLFVDTGTEPTTAGIDALTAATLVACGRPPAVVIGIGGGATLDSAKAVSNLLSNGGKAADYQGWDLLRVPGVFKVGVPTLSGTGAEGSRTCVMMNFEKNLKLGMNSDHTVFDRLVLDPDLTASVPRDQYFHTGLDTYIHCIESIGGSYRHAVADAYSMQALALCREVFLDGDMQRPEARKQLMVASFLGGSAIGNSFVGVVHPLSAGLSMVLHLRHCVANCIVMAVMEEFYPRETEEFHRMLAAQGISLPARVTAGLADADFDALYGASIIHEKPLANALGPDFKSILTRDKVRELFSRM